MKCRVTVAIPAYNAQETIKATVESVLANTYRDFEIIIVSDGSADRTEEEARLLAERDSRIRVISKENGGPGSARNTAIREAAGEYIAFIDADDVVSEDYLISLVSVMEKYHLDWSVCAYYMCREYQGKTGPVCIGRPAFAHDTVYLGKDVKTHLIPAVFQGPNHSSLSSMAMGMYRLRVLRDNGLLVDESIAYGEDMEFNYRVSHFAAGFAFLTRPMYSYYQREDGVTGRFIAGDLIKGRLDFLQKLEKTRKRIGDNIFREYLIHASIQIVQIFRDYIFAVKDRKKRFREYERFFREASRPELRPVWNNICRVRSGPVSQRIFLWAVRGRRFYLVDMMRQFFNLKVFIKENLFER